MIALLSIMTINAQVKDDFESNKLGWNEYDGSKSSSTIINGSMVLTSKGGTPAVVSCWAPYDISRNFDLKCDVLAKKIDDEKNFGIVIDYKDDYNYIMFGVTEGKAIMQKFVENKLVAFRMSDIKLKEQRKANVKLEIKHDTGSFKFYVNDMLALEARYLHVESNGIALYAGGKQKISFDNLEIIQ